MLRFRVTAVGVIMCATVIWAIWPGVGAADPQRRDAGAPGADASAPCSISVAGAIDRAATCVADQPSQRAARDAGGADLAIFDSNGALYLTLHFSEAPRVGALPEDSFIAKAIVEEGDRRWHALWLPGPRRVGAVRVVIEAARTSRSSKLLEVHGRVEAELLPTVEGQASGVAKLHISF